MKEDYLIQRVSSQRLGTQVYTFVVTPPAQFALCQPDGVHVTAHAVTAVTVVTLGAGQEPGAGLFLDLLLQGIGLQKIAEITDRERALAADRAGTVKQACLARWKTAEGVRELKQAPKNLCHQHLPNIGRSTGCSETHSLSECCYLSGAIPFEPYSACTFPASSPCKENQKPCQRAQHSADMLQPLT